MHGPLLLSTTQPQSQSLDDLNDSARVERDKQKSQKELIQVTLHYCIEISKEQTQNPEILNDSDLLNNLGKLAHYLKRVEKLTDINGPDECDNHQMSETEIERERLEIAHLKLELPNCFHTIAKKLKVKFTKQEMIQYTDYDDTFDDTFKLQCQLKMLIVHQKLITTLGLNECFEAVKENKSSLARLKPEHNTIIEKLKSIKKTCKEKGTGYKDNDEYKARRARVEVIESDIKRLRKNISSNEVNLYSKLYEVISKAQKILFRPNLEEQTKPSTGENYVDNFYKKDIRWGLGVEDIKKLYDNKNDLTRVVERSESPGLELVSSETLSDSALSSASLQPPTYDFGNKHLCETNPKNSVATKPVKKEQPKQVTKTNEIATSSSSSPASNPGENKANEIVGEARVVEPPSPVISDTNSADDTGGADTSVGHPSSGILNTNGVDETGRVPTSTLSSDSLASNSGEHKANGAGCSAAAKGPREQKTPVTEEAKDQRSNTKKAKSAKETASSRLGVAIIWSIIAASIFDFACFNLSSPVGWAIICVLSFSIIIPLLTHNDLNDKNMKKHIGKSFKILLVTVAALLIASFTGAYIYSAITSGTFWSTLAMSHAYSNMATWVLTARILSVKLSTIFCGAYNLLAFTVMKNDAIRNIEESVSSHDLSPSQPRERTRVDSGDQITLYANKPSSRR